MNNDLVTRFDREGFAIVESVIDAPTIQHVADAIASALNRHDVGGSKRGGYGMRHLLRDVPEVRALAESREVRAVVEPILGPGAFAVRGLFFDKTAKANWAVGWHQDLQIAVEARRVAEGFGPWSMRDGVAHVQPPTQVMEGIVAVRIHLDDCSADNGALRVIPGSHRHGKLDDSQVHMWMEKKIAVTCEMKRGAALLMRPLLLHASSPATTPNARRVVHLEFAHQPLPGDLQWAAT